MSLTGRILRKGITPARHAILSRSNQASHSIIIPVATYSPWLNDDEFQAVFEIIRHNSLVDIYRAYELWSLVRETAFLSGDILEVGVWRGGTGCLMAARAQELEPEARIFLCDTFEGVVGAGTHDSHYSGGEHADTSIEMVRQLASRLNLKNVEIMKGIFPQATGEQMEDCQFNLCHIDVDVYESARSVTEWVWPKLVLGGVVVYDDYGFAGCVGVTRLVNERHQARESITMHNLNGHAVMVKIG